MSNKKRAYKQQRTEVEAPRELLQLEKTLLSTIREKHTVTNKGKTEELELREILIQKYMQKAFSGSPHALNQITDFIRDTEIREAKKLQHDIEVGLSLKANAEERLLKAIDEGKDPKYVYYHPDDIIVDYSKGWDICGIWNEDLLERVKGIERFCNVLLLQHFLEERLEWPKVEVCEKFPNGTPFKGSAYLFLEVIQKGMPVRFQLGLDAYTTTELHTRKMNRRELLKYVRAQWQSVGCNVSRGYKTMPFEKGYLELKRVFEVL